jgi:hypothetical protein
MYYPRKYIAGKFTSLHVHPTKKLSRGTGRAVTKGGWEREINQRYSRKKFGHAKER